MRNYELFLIDEAQNISEISSILKLMVDEIKGIIVIVKKLILTKEIYQINYDFK